MTPSWVLTRLFARYAALCVSTVAASISYYVLTTMEVHTKVGNWLGITDILPGPSRDFGIWFGQIGSDLFKIPIGISIVGQYRFGSG
jgi:hypothetical protein